MTLPGSPEWLDVQRLNWGLGNQPGLQAVVAWALGRWMDKSLQTSDWNHRPLSDAQKACVEAFLLSELGLFEVKKVGMCHKIHVKSM